MIGCANFWAIIFKKVKSEKAKPKSKRAGNKKNRHYFSTGF